MVVGRLRFYRDSSSSIFFFQLYPPSSLNGTQPKPATCSEVNAIWKCMSEIWGKPSSDKSRAPKPPFSTTWQLNGNFNGLYLPNETWRTQSGKCVSIQKGSPTSSQNVMNFGPQNWTAILQTLRKICILLHCQASKTISKRNSTKLMLIICLRKVGVVPPKQMGSCV